MRELSLFSGCGGGLLGTHLLGWRPIGYVEFNDYCQRVIAQRIADGILPIAPIFGDVRTFVSEGYAAAYTGMVDCLTGGFPCQPFSVAGKRAGADDPRNMWPATLDTIRAVRPRYCFLENVPGLLASGYFERILCDLTESGYSVRWRCLSAAELGAPHQRDRLWIMAHTQSYGHRRHDGEPGDNRRTWAHGEGKERLWGSVERGGAYLAYPACQQDRRLQQREISPHVETGSQSAVSDAEVERDVRGNSYSRESRQVAGRGANQHEGSNGNDGGQWWEAEPRLGRLADGVPNRVDRLKAAGNAQVPAVVRAAWHLLTEGI